MDVLAGGVPNSAPWQGGTEALVVAGDPVRAGCGDALVRQVFANDIGRLSFTAAKGWSAPRVDHKSCACMAPVGGPLTSSH